MYSCAVIGHKPTRFRLKYNENESRCKRLKRRLRDQFVLLYDQGVRRFLLGGALGVDMWSGEILLQLKEQSEYSGIELVLVLPHPEHDLRWDKRSRARMAALMAHCTEQITVSAVPGPESYYKRNRYLADHAG